MRSATAAGKRQLKAALAKSRARSLARTSSELQCKRIVILCYHSIHPEKGFASASPAQFEAQLEWLKANCEIIRFRDAFAAARSASARGDRPRVALTFDDGYADNFEHAFPLLVKHGLTATFFVTAGLLERDRTVLERLHHLRNARYEDVLPLDWHQVREMQRGGMDVGSHTYSHPNLIKLDAASAIGELRNSRRIIEDRLGAPIDTLAYPFGMVRRHVGRETMALAAEAGYRFAATVAFRAVERRDDAMALPRFLVTRDEVETISEKVGGAWDFMGWWYKRAPLWLIGLVSPQGGAI